jgi:hypothetical protein
MSSVITLAALVAALAEERHGVLEVVALDDLAQRLARLQRRAVAGVDVPDLPLRDRDQRHLVEPELPRPQPQVIAAAQELRLIAGLAVDRDDVPLGDRAAV